MTQWVSTLVVQEDRLNMKINIDNAIKTKNLKRHLIPYGIHCENSEKRLEASGHLCANPQKENDIIWLRGLTRVTSDITPRVTPGFVANFPTFSFLGKI